MAGFVGDARQWRKFEKQAGETRIGRDGRQGSIWPKVAAGRQTQRQPPVRLDPRAVVRHDPERVNDPTNADLTDRAILTTGRAILTTGRAIPTIGRVMG